MTRTRRTKPSLNIPANARCSICGRTHSEGATWNVHHLKPLVDGGSNELSNLVILCSECHVNHHSGNGDFKVWGRRGGRVTSENPFNWMRNLRQFRTWSDERLQEYVDSKYSLTLFIPEYEFIAA